MKDAPVFSKLEQQSKNICYLSLVFSILLLILAFVTHRWDRAFGVLAGTGLGILNYYLLLKKLKSIQSDNEEEKSILSSMLLRYAIIGACFFLVIIIPFIDALFTLVSFSFVHLSFGVVWALKGLKRSSD